MSTTGRRWSRRELLGAMGVAGAAGILGGPRLSGVLSGFQTALAAEAPPETTKITLIRSPESPACLGPQYYSEKFLRDEGFTHVQYDAGTDKVNPFISWKADMSMDTNVGQIIPVDEGKPRVIVGGVHVGCFELFGTNRVRSFLDLKGKTVAAGPAGVGMQALLASMMAYVGLDPRKDVKWFTGPLPEAMQLFTEGKIDGFFGLPPLTQELRAKKIGRVLVNTMIDRPWSQYFCCLVAVQQDYLQKYPVATKRALRAILRATDACAREPETVARFLVNGGYMKRYDYTLQALREIPFNRWREYNVEDTVRFFALRLREVGLIKNSPQAIIARGTDWRFFNELKREMKRSQRFPAGAAGHHAGHQGG
jgi:NitT/TauT family transport system substrate-binding protein